MADIVGLPMDRRETEGAATMTQLSLFTRPPYTVGPCAYGDGTADWYGPHHCAACAAHVAAVVAQRAA